MLEMAIHDPIARLLGDWSMQFGLWSVLLRIGLSFLLAAIIGCERANKRHSAGLRTFTLVSIASAAAMIADMYLGETAGFRLPAISAAAVIGIAVITANSIIYSSRSQVKGLTTAAALWAGCIIGLTAGAGLYTVTLAAFGADLCCMFLLPGAEKYLKDRSNHFEIHLELKDKQYLRDFIGTIRKLGLKIDDIELNPAYQNSGLGVFTILLTITGEELRKYKTHKEIIEALGTLDYVNFIEEIR